ncbi:hypothetical protein [Flavobacterium sp. 25HG05S-40]|uniref:hypothetical protein n=1 Tax=Flavobacterium sp. 25HG05S-40 TaxID=3458682 RepID=UPI004044B7F4
MVQITGYKTYQREDGENFHILVLQGGIEAVKSQQTGKTYLTTKMAKVSCTFDEATCESLIGTKLPGAIKRVEVEPYEFTIAETGEVVERSHRYEYISEEEAIVGANVLEKEEVM